MDLSFLNGRGFGFWQIPFELLPPLNNKHAILLPECNRISKEQNKDTWVQKGRKDTWTKAQDIKTINHLNCR